MHGRCLYYKLLLKTWSIIENKLEYKIFTLYVPAKTRDIEYNVHIYILYVLSYK